VGFKKTRVLSERQQAQRLPRSGLLEQGDEADEARPDRSLAAYRRCERGHLEFASLLCSDGEGKDQALAAPKAVVGYGI
jgi:hypothetical protein